jgi:omega-6 fatty acid desaturase (delta-12 desaturase)
MTATTAIPGNLAIRRMIQPFETAIPRRSAWQLATSVLPLIGLYAAMYASLDLSYWLTLALAVPAAGFTVRTFIVQHDCGHGSFLGSRRANTWVGRLCILFTLTPYENWRAQHAVHHRISNNLDRRTGGADMFAETQTASEYRQMSRLARLGYRVGRHPLICHILLPPLVFIVLYRLPFDTPRHWKRERRSVLLTNVVLIGMFGLLGWWLGFKAVALVHVPVIALAAIAGIWLFAVQHRFDQTQWYREQDWSPVGAALGGTSWLRLPKVLQWFSGSIGLHHLHHLSPRVANYRLQECMEANPELQGCRSLSLREALGASRYWLWDEDRHKMISFRECGKVRLNLEP